MRTSNKHVIVFATILFFIFKSTFSQQNIEVDSTLIEIEDLSEKAKSFYKQGDYEKALPIQERAIKLYYDNNIVDNGLLFKLYVNISACYGENRILDKSLEYAEKAKSIAKKHNVPTLDLIGLYTSLAYIESEYNKNPQKALGYITMSHELLIKQKTNLLKENRTQYISLRANILEWFISLQMLLKNEKQLTKAHKQFELFYQTHKKNTEVKHYFALGSFKMGRFYQHTQAELASQYFDFAIKHGRKEQKIYGNICSALGYLHDKQLTKIPPYINALSKFKDLSRSQRLNILELECSYYSTIKDINKLIASSNKAFSLLDENNSEFDVLNFNSNKFKPSKNYRYPVLLYQFGVPLQSSEDKRLAITANKIYKICLSQFDERIGRTSIEKYAFFYSILKGKLFNHILKDNLSYEEKLDIITKMERIETQSTFNTTLSNRSLSEQKTNLDSLFTKEINLREQITSLKLNNSENDSITKQQLFKLELELEKLYDNIEQANPLAYDISTNKFSIDDINIDNEQAIFKFHKGSDDSSYMIKASKNGGLKTHLYRTKITKNNIEIEDLGDYESFERDVISLLNTLKSPNGIETINSQSKSLYNSLFKNTSVPKNIVIISDNILRYLPFEILNTNDNYLIEQSVISYSGGLSFLSDLNISNTKHTQSVSFFAPSYSKEVLSSEQLAVRGDAYNLEGAKSEVQTLSKLTDGNVYEGNKASKKEFLNLNNNSSIIHYAGHAFLNDKQPELSGFIFSDNETDNTLYVSELYGFKSNASLAVLSACNTGVGGYESGKGIVSLSQAFMYAGVPSTVSSLWSAPDLSTKQIMINFYENLNTGQKKSESLRIAKLNYLNNTTNPKLKHPYYWAGFVLYGNDAPIIFNKGFNSNYYILFGLILVSFIVLLLWKKKSN